MVADIGHNKSALVTVDELARDYGYIVKAIEEREAEAAKAPPVIEDDEDLDIVHAIVPKLRGAAKRCDELRVDVKRPHLEAGRTIQEWFDALATRMTTLQSALEQRATSYLKKKQAAEEARRRAEEAKQRAEAERQAREAAEAARAGEADRAARAAAAAAEASARAEQAAEPTKAADLARTSTSSGTSTLAEKWVFQITDWNALDLNGLRPYLSRADVEKAIKSYIRSGRRELNGVRIFIETKARLR